MNPDTEACLRAVIRRELGEAHGDGRIELHDAGAAPLFPCVVNRILARPASRYSAGESLELFLFSDAFTINWIIDGAGASPPKPEGMMRFLYSSSWGMFPILAVRAPEGTDLLAVVDRRDPSTIYVLMNFVQP